MSVPKRGRPTRYTEGIAVEICERLAKGESLASICRDAHMPAEPRVREWALEDRADKSGAGAGFAARYARARAIGYERLADELIRISEDPCLGADGYVDNAAVQRARLMSDNRKWLLSKMLPKQFGDRVAQEITGDNGGALITRIELVPVDPRPRQGELSADGDEAGEVRRFPPRLTDRRSG